MGPVRVALISLGRRGGGTAYSLQVAKALGQLCQVVSVVSSYAQNIQEWRASRLKILEIPTYASPWQFMASSFNLGMYLRIVSWIRRMRTSVVYYPMLHPWAPILNSLMRDIPKVVTVHDPVMHLGERNRVLDTLQTLSVRQASRVVVLSKAAAELLASRGVDLSKIDVVPHGEFSFYRQVASRHSSAAVERSEPRLLFFGRIAPYKGLGVLLEAFEAIRARIPNARLDIVGSGDLGPYRRQLETLGNSVRVVNRWVPDEEVDAYFRVADLVVLPYVDASQSGVVPIAYSYKLPVVASDVGGLAEQVLDGETGRLVPRGDAAGLAAACTELLSDPASRRRMGEAGYRKAMTEWSWRRVALGVYDSLRKASGNVAAMG